MMGHKPNDWCDCYGCTTMRRPCIKDKAKRPFASKIKLMRKASGMTQAQFAKEVGLSRPSIANIEAGKQNITTEHIYIFCEVFSCTANDLLCTGKIKLNQLQAENHELKAKIHKAKTILGDY